VGRRFLIWLFGLLVLLLMTICSSNYTANMNKNFQEYTEIPIDLGHRDPACQTAFGKPHLKGQNGQKKKRVNL
jgi:hypothetical protein